ncbi:MAG: hypothetical protein ABI910_24175, partial [Gemmatimonadota bacterium]
GVALTPVAHPGQLLIRSPDSLMDLAPAPRALVGEAAERYRKLAPSLWRHANPGGIPVADNLWGVGVAIFIGTITFGILPAMIAAVGATRRRRLKHFFTLGTPAIAEVTAIEGEKDELGGRIGRVRFQFEADGQPYRASDLVSQTVADRWRPGDQIEILYLRESDYDGVIISTR